MTDQRKKSDGKAGKPAKGRPASGAARDRGIKAAEMGMMDEDRALLHEISVPIDSLGKPEEGPSAGPPAAKADPDSMRKRRALGERRPETVNPSPAKAPPAAERRSVPPSSKAPAEPSRQALPEAPGKSDAPARKAPQKKAGKRVAVFLAAGGLMIAAGAVGHFVLFPPAPRPEPQKPVKFSVKNVPGVGAEAAPSGTDNVVAPAGPAPPSAEPDRPAAFSEPPAQKAGPAATPSAAAARHHPETEIMAFLASWEKAWEASAGPNGRIDPYIAHFSENFQDGPVDLGAWRADKAAKNRRKEWIRIGIRNVRISPPAADGRVTVTFLQTYQSSNYSDKTEKTLVLDREGDRWKIIGFGGPGASTAP